MYRYFFKRVVDFIVSLLAIIILLPFLLVIIICLHFANKGAGVFFTQERPGFKGQIFKVIKFKSMTDEVGPDGILLPNELRITSIGRFIRRYSIDELPQLFNVLVGDMALIGPRPLMIRYLKLYSKEQARRHDVKPGITGWAQINGRNAISWSKKFELDVWYVDNLSFILDLKIIFLTIKKIVSHQDINSSNGKVGAVGFDGTN